MRRAHSRKTSDEPRAPASFVYFARGRKSEMVKIGYSTDPKQRVFGVSSDHSEPVKLLFYRPGTMKDERQFHLQFKQYRDHGEWFREYGQLARFIKEETAKFKRSKPARKVYKKVAKAEFAEPVSPLVLKRNILEGSAQIVGYARVSTDKQVMDVQLKALHDMGCDPIFSETISASNARRPEYYLMRKHIEPGDTLVVYSFSRLSRDLKQLLTIVDELKAQGIKLISTSEPHIDPYTRSGRQRKAGIPVPAIAAKFKVSNSAVYSHT